MRSFFTYFVLAGIVLCWSACQKPASSPSVVLPVGDFPNAVVHDWNAKFLEIERDAEGYRPLPATRALAYLGLSAYEACLPGMPTHKSLLAQCPGLAIPPANAPESLHWPTVVNASYAYLMRRFFPLAANQADALETSNNAVYQAQVSASVFTLSQQYGREVAGAVWEWSKTDVVGHDAYLHPLQSHQYQPGNAPFPTEPGPPMLFPDWGHARHFAITEADKICSAPLAYGQDARLYAEAVEVYARSQNVSPGDDYTSEFWSDEFVHVTFSTGARWISVANQIYANDEADLETAIYCNAKLGFALNDAAVACWASKYHYNVASPVLYIQEVLDPNWQPSLQNPLTGTPGPALNFPTYPSEHAVLAGAAAEVLTDIFGTDYAFTDFSHANATLFNGAPRSFSSFYEMSEDCAVSRIPAGLNFRMDCEQGIGLGYRCGQKVNALPWTN